MTAKREKRRREDGFTLIELIVVITIIGILSTVVVVNVVGRTDQTKITKVKADFAAIQQAAGMFRADHGRWPDSLEELLNPPEPESGQAFEYLSKQPLDPWTNEFYQYEVTDDGILLVSLGADMAEGGTDINTDIRTDELDQR